MTTANSKSSSLIMAIAVAVIAFAGDDTVHELIGHGTTCWLLGIKLLSISTVALQSAESGKWTAAAGAMANVMAGILAFILFGRMRDFSPFRYLLWLFGFVNLMNGTGYLWASALLNYGDWAVVIAGWTPVWAWRTGMGLIGVATFAASVRWAAGLMRGLVTSGVVATRDITRLCLPAYIAGGLMFTAASALNRITPGQILSSGVGASFGLTFGLLLVPGMATAGATADGRQAQPLQLHWDWVVLAVVIGVIFVGVFGPGVRFS